MFCALLKCSVRSCHLIYVLLFSSIVAGIYSGVCCAVLRTDSNSFDGASLIDSVDESNSIVHDGDVQDDSSIYKDCSILRIVGDMDDSVLLNAMQCLLNIAKKHNDDGLIKSLQLSEMSNYASKGNDATALQGAAVNHDHLIKFLRDNINTSTYEPGGGLLTCAIPFGNNKLIELLIESGTKVDSLDTDQYMPLHKAVRYGEIEIVKILLNAGADANYEGLSKHIRNESDSILRTICANPGKFITPLQIAILCDDFETVKVLLDRKANPNCCIKGQDSPLYMAVNVDSNNILTALLSAGAEINIKDCWNSNILQYAVSMSRSPDIIKTIISYGDQYIIERESVFHETPLSIAIRNESNVLVNTLINNGANTNYRHDDGTIPLCIATYGVCGVNIIGRKMVDIFEILISAGGNVNCQDQCGLTPLMIIVNKDSYVYENNNSIVTIKLIFNMLLRNSADINMIDKKGNTALHYAAKKGISYFISLLLHYGAKRNIKNRNGLTAVECALSDNIFTTISNAPFVAMQPARMKTIARNSIRSLIIEKKQAKQSLNNMISTLKLPKIIRDFLFYPLD